MQVAGAGAPGEGRSAVSEQAPEPSVPAADLDAVERHRSSTAGCGRRRAPLPLRPAGRRHDRAAGSTTGRRSRRRST
nr:hypothetical protein [Angustibacter aerolatus]